MKDFEEEQGCWKRCKKVKGLLLSGFCCSKVKEREKTQVCIEVAGL